MTSQKLLAGSGWSPPWALPGAVRDEADGVQGGCGEEISELPVVPVISGLFGKERSFKTAGVVADRSKHTKWADQEDEATGKESRLESGEEVEMRHMFVRFRKCFTTQFDISSLLTYHCRTFGFRASLTIGEMLTLTMRAWPLAE